MDSRLIDDWCLLTGASVEIRSRGVSVCSGTVDDVTDDGGILWIRSSTEGRRLFEKTASFEAWAVEERLGFHYRVSAR